MRDAHLETKSIIRFAQEALKLMNNYLEPLFKYLKKHFEKGVIGLSYSRIEEILGRELSYDARAFNHHWTQASIKRLMNKYGIKFGYINTLTGIIYFELH